MDGFCPAEWMGTKAWGRAEAGGGKDLARGPSSSVGELGAEAHCKAGLPAASAKGYGAQGQCHVPPRASEAPDPGDDGRKLETLAYPQSGGQQQQVLSLSCPSPGPGLGPWLG